MSRLSLDYQSDNKPFPWAGVLLLALFSMALILLGVYYTSLLEKTTYWDVKNKQAQPSVARKAAASQRELSDMAVEIKHANEVLNQITLPWDKLFQAVEWSSGKEVTLLAMEPDAERHEVKISGEAKNIAAVLNYVRLLTDQEIFSNVYLQSHQVQLQTADKPVRFALLAAWKIKP